MKYTLLTFLVFACIPVWAQLNVSAKTIPLTHPDGTFNVQLDSGKRVSVLDTLQGKLFVRYQGQYVGVIPTDAVHSEAKRASFYHTSKMKAQWVADSLYYAKYLGSKQRADSLHRAETMDERMALLRDRYNSNLKRWGKQAADNIKNHVVWIGMTAEQAEMSWGEPTRVNRTVTAGSSHEQWVYESEGAYLYFHNGKLTSWQE